MGAPISSCAWPRPAGAQHILLLGPGCPFNAGEETENFARDVAIKAPSKIIGDTQDAHVIPNLVEDFHDLKEVFFFFSALELIAAYLLIITTDLGGPF